MNNPTLSASTGASHARILGTGSVRGDRVVTNEEMCTMIDSTPEWIEPVSYTHLTLPTRDLV